jgi:rare lipoprotein A
VAASIFTLHCARARFVPVNSGVQVGTASWYGSDFHGKPTSSREVYDMNQMTAAHRTLPFGTEVMVTNLSNGRSVCVRINDRGPFVDDRIVDLSFAAARLIDLVGPGTAKVRLEVLAGRTSGLKPVRYVVQVGSFIREDNARHLASRLRPAYRGVYVSAFETGTQTYYRVRVRADGRRDSEALAARLNADGYPVLICEGD